jgi:hypothetical protein
MADFLLFVFVTVWLFGIVWIVWQSANGWK